MTSKLQTNPITASIIFTLILVFLWGAAQSFIQGLPEQHGVQTPSLIMAVVNIVLALATIAMIGVINQVCGFRHVFRADGFVKGLPAALPLMAAALFNVALS